MSMSKSRFLLATIVLVASSVAGTTSVSATTATTWTPATTAPPHYWEAVTYGNGIFVAMSNNSVSNQFATSTNGTDWTTVSVPSQNSDVWRSLTFGNGLFVAVSNDARNGAITSTNGLDWTIQAIPDERWNLVTYGNGIFVAVAYNRKTATSTDGVNWTLSGVIPLGDQNDSTFTSGAYGNGIFVVVGDNGLAAISTDNGATWTTSITGNDQILWRSVVFADVPQIGPQFVAVGYDNLGNGRTMNGTINGSSITWAVSTDSIPEGELSSVTFADGVFVAVADWGFQSRVFKGEFVGTNLQWSIPINNNLPQNSWNSVIYGDGLFVAVAETGTNRIMTSGTFTGGNQTPEPTPNVGNAPATDSNSGSSTPSGGSDPIPSASQPGVTVTDSKIYTTLPRRVADNSSIAVLTARQTRTQRLRTQTPAVCLTTNDDIVFIDEGRCNVSVLSKKTGEVLRRLRTTVIDTEVVELGIGNEIATLAPIYFENGSSNLSRAASRRIASLKDRISEAGSVLVVGHTGIMTGDTAENRALSRSRAVNTVREMKRSGAVGPFFSVAVGAANPDVNDTSRSAQSKNRRVVIVLVP
jgi:outer membrane protein OmpA-like peptidoglycan-associated protein